MVYCSNSTSRTSLMNFLLEPASLKRSQCLTGTGEEEREREREISFRKGFLQKQFPVSDIRNWLSKY